MKNLCLLLVGLFLFATGSRCAFADVAERNVTIFSEGIRLHATLYQSGAARAPLPTIVMSHGWGGTAAMLRPQAQDFAKAGYLVIAFDYRGWGESGARLVWNADATSTQPTDNAGGWRALREVVDPLDQAMDLQNVLHWAAGEPKVDKTRIGLWGTSFSGGLVVYAAARDRRVHAVVSQVGYMGQALETFPRAQLDKAYADATRRARGELEYPQPGAREIGNLRGAPIREKFLNYAPVNDAALVNCPILFIAAEHEELFDNRQHPELAYEHANEPKRYVVIPGISHYGVYAEARNQATRLAIDWFNLYLKQ